MAARDPPFTPSLVARAPITGGQPLNNSIPGQHPAIDGEVPTHHERTHGSVFLCQLIRFVGQVGTVLSPVNEHEAGEARATPVDLIHGVSPPAALAQAVKILDIEATHHGFCGDKILSHPSIQGLRRLKEVITAQLQGISPKQPYKGTPRVN